MGHAQEQPPSTPAVAMAAPPAPPQTTRRPRVREVSSRFMSPVSTSRSSISSSTAGDIHLLPSGSPRHEHHHQLTHRSISAHRRRQLKMGEADENNRSSETARSLDSPFQTLNSHGHGAGAKNSKISAKPLRENCQRIDTPSTFMAPPSSRSRVSNQRSLSASAAAKLLHSSGMSFSSCQQPNDRDKFNDSSSASNSDLLPNRNQSSKHFSNSAASPLSRSISSTSSSCDDSYLIRLVKGNEKLLAGLSLPPVPHTTKPPVDVKKAKKVLGHQEDVHSMKLMYNHYLQWRYANVMADVRTKSQKQHVERMLYTQGLKVSELYDSVQKKRIELQRLLRIKTLTAVLESQIPYLEDWSTLEADYSASLSEATQALLNASQRLPLGADVRIDTKEFGEALSSAAKLMEGITSNVGGLMPKAEEVETITSELARITGGERGLIEDCGVLLSKIQASQIEECCLRSQLMQFHHKNSIC